MLRLGAQLVQFLPKIFQKRPLVPNVASEISDPAHQFSGDRRMSHLHGDYSIDPRGLLFDLHERASARLHLRLEIGEMRVNL